MSLAALRWLLPAPLYRAAGFARPAEDLTAVRPPHPPPDWPRDEGPAARALDAVLQPLLPPGTVRCGGADYGDPPNTAAVGAVSRTRRRLPARRAPPADPAAAARRAGRRGPRRLRSSPADGNRGGTLRRRPLRHAPSRHRATERNPVDHRLDRLGDRPEHGRRCRATSSTRSPPLSTPQAPTPTPPRERAHEIPRCSNLDLRPRWSYRFHLVSSTKGPSSLPALAHRRSY